MSRNEHGRSASGSGQIPAIPLTDADLGPQGAPTIGNLVKDATASASTLFRSEVALAKAEVVGEAKKAGTASGLLVVAGVMALYASLFFFWFLGELLDLWVSRWLAFLIVFLILLIITIISGVVGVIIFKRVRGPKKTISSAQELKSVLPRPAALPDTDHPRIPPARKG
ncbi:MAG: phage holin family protein [Gordonia sp. (in: high G+C Gram-positive bacteria)]